MPIIESTNPTLMPVIKSTDQTSVPIIEIEENIIEQKSVANMSENIIKNIEKPTGKSLESMNGNIKKTIQNNPSWRSPKIKPIDDLGMFLLVRMEY